MIVCHDADMDTAAKGAVSGRFFNCGQTCTAVKRVFVDEQIEESFTRRVQELASKLVVGNGLEPRTTLGPVHTSSQRLFVHDIVRKTLDAGMAKLMSGGEMPSDPNMQEGNFYEPTILSAVDPDAPVMKDEVFGPVLPITSYENFDDAIDFANSTRFGLGASVWTHDARIISRAAGELDAGIVWVNQHLRIPPEVPFGGMKSSGSGRENGRYALEQYLEEKTILINP